MAYTTAGFEGRAPKSPGIREPRRLPAPPGTARVPCRARPPMQRLAVRLCVSAALVTLAVGYAGPAEADIFSFKDEEGVIHFVNKPSGDARYKLVVKAPKAKRANVVAFMPSDTSADRFTRYDEWIRQASILYQIP